MPVCRFCLVLLILPFISSCLSRREQPAPVAVLAEVNGVTIKEDALRSRLSMENFKADEDEGQAGKDPFVSLDVKKETLNRMVQHRAIADWGKKQGIALTDEELVKGLNKFKKGYTEREFEMMLEEKNITYSQWSEFAREDLTVQKIIDADLYRKIKVTPAELATNYRNNKDQFMVDERVHVRHIFTDTSSKAAELYQRVTHGENFAKVALMHSISPVAPILRNLTTPVFHWSRER